MHNKKGETPFYFYFTQHKGLCYNKFMNNYVFKTHPYAHQTECLLYGVHHNNFLLADQQGLGKTKEVIDLACYLKQQYNYKHCLIICGVNGLKWNWKEEVLIHSNEKSHILGEKTVRGRVKIGSTQERLADLENIDNLPYFIITNIETLRQKVKTGRKIKKRIKRKMQLVDEYKYPITDKLVELCDKGVISLIAADECHKMKNPDSEQGEQFLRLNADRKVAMTGTPLMNTPMDLFIILKWLGYEEHSFWQFKTHFCRLGGYGGHEIVGYKNMSQLSELLDTMMLRRMKDDVLDLPQKIYKNVYVDMSSEQQRIYNEVYNELSASIDMIVQSSNPLSRLIRLRQATGYPGILSSKVTKSAKLDRMEELVKDIIDNNEKVIIFSNWTSITDEVVSRLYKLNPLVITGETKDETRQNIVQQFQSDPQAKVLVGTIGALGTGLTLTAARNIIFLDEPWNRALREQAEDRAHRIGQMEPVNIYFLLTKNTIDERIHSLVEEKGAISDAIVDKSELVSYLLS